MLTNFTKFLKNVFYEYDKHKMQIVVMKTEQNFSFSISTSATMYSYLRSLCDSV